MTTETLVSDSVQRAGTDNQNAPVVSVQKQLREKQETGKVAVDDSWIRLCQDFLRCHRQTFNVTAHLLTTPLSLIAVLGGIYLLSPTAMLATGCVYLVVIAPVVPFLTWVATAVCVVLMMGLVALVQPSWIFCAAALAVGYLGQECAHWIAGEKTLQSTYQGKKGWLLKLFEHTMLLLPVLLVIAGRRRQSPLRFFVARKAVLGTKLTSENHCEDLNHIRTWVKEEHPTLETSTHWWQNDLPGDAGEAFDRLSEDRQILRRIQRYHGPGYEVRPVLRMNEIYVTGPPKKSTSDTVFYMGHVDGPWAVFPGARLYRCMLAASPNLEVTTHYPMSGTDYRQPEGHRLENGDALAFDFNRELHYITREPSEKQTEQRINLKLHFVAYPKTMGFYGKLLDDLTSGYNTRARRLFLNTIDPNSLVQKVKTKWVLGWTKIFELVVKHIGWTNMAFVALLAAISAAVGDWRILLIATSFVHYFIYMGTIRETEPVSFGTFRRNAMLFKTVSFVQLFGLYAMSFANQWLSLGVVLAGFGLATLATWRLGVARTYFSSELGFDPPEKISGFPYGVIPHPMILGAVLGLAGMLIVPEFRRDYGWLVAGHIGLYLAVLIQEILLNRKRFAAAA